MTKNEELQLIREFTDRLGPDSYLGPVLGQSFVAIEAAIRSDFIPPGIDALIKEQADILRNYTREVTEAEKLLDYVRKEVEKAKGEARRLLVLHTRLAEDFHELHTTAFAARQSASKSVDLTRTALAAIVAP